MGKCILFVYFMYVLFYWKEIVVLFFIFFNVMLIFNLELLDWMGIYKSNDEKF